MHDRHAPLIWMLCAAASLLAWSGSQCLGDAEQATDPYSGQVAMYLDRLDSDATRTRAAAAEALGFLRAYAAEPALIARLGDDSARVRREAALALAWCGGRACVDPLITTLSDADWSCAQSAWVALTNVTGMEFPFDALSEPTARQAQAGKWREWWNAAPKGGLPAEVVALLKGPPNIAFGCEVTASTTYKGPTSLLTDGKVGDQYWQTKLVPYPQHCTVDLGKPMPVATVTVYQNHTGFYTTEYALEVSTDGEAFEQVVRKKATTGPTLIISFEPRTVRYVRVLSYANAQENYPTTFHEIEVSAVSKGEQERGLRALGALGGKQASATILDRLEHLRAYPDRILPSQRRAIQAGLRSLGRLQDAEALPWLMSWVWETQWARYAAEALGDFGDPRAIPALISAYPQYGETLRGDMPPRLPEDDRPGFEWLDRKFETPYAIACALSRLPWDDARDRAALRTIAPLLVANIPEDFDGAMVYEPESHQMVTAYLLERAGMRQEACETAFTLLGQPRRVPVPGDAPALPARNATQVGPWLATLCRDRADVPRLIALLEHKDGWVRINAAKALAFIGDQQAVAPLARLLTESKAEADYGYSGVFLDEEYKDPAARFREGWAQALGLLGAREHVGLLARIANDERSVLEVRYAAAEALAKIASPDAMSALGEIAARHPFQSVRQVAREALWLRGETITQDWGTEPPKPQSLDAQTQLPTEPEAIVFIKGENAMPNDYQSDFWRQTYVTTDSGPTYRPGRNLYVLRPPKPDGKVAPLTSFEDGYVADCEVSWDGERVVFARRGEKDPWWHIWQVEADGSDLRQLTDGPYHDVCPAYLPDGRIVLTSSRIGMRDEYHGYLATALHVMDADGGGIHPISVNAGRDNEPAITNDGRIVFSRLEVFYSRLKTELTVHTVEPDGTRDVVIYGPERRDFWRALDVGPRGEDYSSNVHPLHRILRLTQPQAMPDGRIVCVSQGGLVLIGPDRRSETIIPHDKQRAFTSPFPLPDGDIICASTIKTKEESDVDIGLYRVDPTSGDLTLIYNDPENADYEARPLMPRQRPPLVARSTGSNSFTGRFVCTSTRNTQEQGVAEYGRLVRVIEGKPVVSRHSTQTNSGPVWRNHGGTIARVLGTVPQAADGSFFVEVPADRLLHFQVLDSDRRVLGNLLTWVYTRPGETRSCVGCHEQPGSTPVVTARPQAVGAGAVECLPDGDEFRYRAKVWLKGTLPDEADVRTRTVRSVNMLARE